MIKDAQSSQLLSTNLGQTFDFNPPYFVAKLQAEANSAESVLLQTLKRKTAHTQT